MESSSSTAMTKADPEYKKPGMPGIIYSDPRQLAGKLPNCGKIPDFAKQMFRQAEENIKLAEQAEAFEQAG